MKDKSPTSPDEAMKSAEEAIAQIFNRYYIYELKGNVVLYDIAFAGKEPHIVSKVLPNTS